MITVTGVGGGHLRNWHPRLTNPINSTPKGTVSSGRVCWPNLTASWILYVCQVIFTWVAVKELRLRYHNGYINSNSSTNNDNTN